MLALADSIEGIIRTEKSSLADFGISGLDELEKLRRSYLDISKLVKRITLKIKKMMKMN